MRLVEALLARPLTRINSLEVEIAPLDPASGDNGEQPENPEAGDESQMFGSGDPDTLMALSISFTIFASAEPPEDATAPEGQGVEAGGGLPGEPATTAEPTATAEPTTTAELPEAPADLVGP